jgi:hypothetical protein
MSGVTQRVSKLSHYLTIRNSLFALVGVLVMAVVVFNVIGAVSATNTRHRANQVVAHNTVQTNKRYSSKVIAPVIVGAKK